MRRSSIFKKIKTTLLGAALLATFAFGVQSIALPIHAVAHAAGHTRADRDSAKVSEAECGLCFLAMQPAAAAVPLSALAHFELRASLALEILTTVFASPSVTLPPARAPPASSITYGL